MKKVEIKTFKDFLEILDGFNSLSKNVTLYRGQTHNYDLLPSIARKSRTTDTTDIEKKMLLEFKRRTITDGLSSFLKTEWDWIIFGQHYGLKTRLLDWSTNPLISLWFGLFYAQNDSYLYVLSKNKETVLSDIDKDPFSLNETIILKPAFNNKRIISQSGWFTVHNFQKDEKSFVPLNDCTVNSKNLLEIKIAKRYTTDFIKKLDIMGINAEFIYQDITGTSTYINWQFNI